MQPRCVHVESAAPRIGQIGRFYRRAHNAMKPINEFALETGNTSWDRREVMD